MGAGLFVIRVAGLFLRRVQGWWLTAEWFEHWQSVAHVVKLCGAGFRVQVAVGSPGYCGLFLLQALMGGSGLRPRRLAVVRHVDVWTGWPGYPEVGYPLPDQGLAIVFPDGQKAEWQLTGRVIEARGAPVY